MLNVTKRTTRLLFKKLSGMVAGSATGINKGGTVRTGLDARVLCSLPEYLTQSLARSLSVRLCLLAKLAY